MNDWDEEQKSEVDLVLKIKELREEKLSLQGLARAIRASLPYDEEFSGLLKLLNKYEDA